MTTPPADACATEVRWNFWHVYAVSVARAVMTSAESSGVMRSSAAPVSENATGIDARFHDATTTRAALTVDARSKNADWLPGIQRNAASRSIGTTCPAYTLHSGIVIRRGSMMTFTTSPGFGRT